MQIIRRFALNLRKVKNTQNRENNKNQNKTKKQNVLKTNRLTTLFRLKSNVEHQIENKIDENTTQN